MKKTLMLILVITFILTLLSGCAANTKTSKSDEKELITRQYDYEGFNKIEVTSAFQVEIKQGDAYSINVTYDDFSRIKLGKDGDILKVGRQGKKWFTPSHRIPIVRMTVPNLDLIDLSGATKGTMSNFHSNNNLTLRVAESSHLSTINISATKLVVEISGASDLRGTLKAMSVADFIVSGSSTVELIGEAADISAKVSGSSRCNLINYSVCNAEINVSGASNAWVNLNGRLDASVSGASNLTYLGNPAPIEIETSGGSYLCMHHLAYTDR
jgi:hypothetical protein